MYSKNNQNIGRLELQVNGNEEGDKVVNLLSAQSVGQFRRQQRVRARQAAQDKRLNTKGDDLLMQEHSRARHIVAQLTEQFTFMQYPSYNNLTQNHHVADEFGRSLGIVGFSCNVTVSPTGDFAEVHGTKPRDVRTFIVLRVYPEYEIIVFYAWRGNPLDIENAFTAILLHLPHHAPESRGFLLVPNYNNSGITGQGNLILNKVIRKYRQCHWADRSTAYSVLQELEARHATGLSAAGNGTTPTTPSQT